MRTPGFFLILILFLSSCRSRETVLPREESVRVRLSPIIIKELNTPVHSTGILISTEEMKLSFKQGGIISAINVKEGERVRKGEVLASLNLSEINATFNQAKNGYEKALRDFTRAENLYRDSVATLELKQNAATALEVSKSALDAVKFNLEHSSITAPDNGMILKQLARPNEMISAGYPVFLFGSSGRYWKVKTGLPDKDIVKIDKGDSAIVTFDAFPSVKFHAVVDQVGGISDPYTGTYETELLIDGSGHRLISGFVAGVDIFPASKKKFRMVPLGSVVEADGQNGYVYTVTDSGIVQKLRISIEGLPDTLAAVSGIPENITRVVSGGAAYLRNGMKVQIVN